MLPQKKCCKGLFMKRVDALEQIIPTTTYAEKGQIQSCQLKTEPCSDAHMIVANPTFVTPSIQLGPQIVRQHPVQLLTYYLAPTESLVAPDQIMYALRNSESCDNVVDNPGSPLCTSVIRTFVMGDDVGFMQSDNTDLVNLDCIPLALGPTMLLSSHCIMVLNHYLDFVDAAAHQNDSSSMLAM